MNNTQSITSYDIDQQPHHTTTDQLKWRPSVYGVIIQDGKVLLSRQWDGHDFPGGGIHLGETIEQALIREVKEETGLEVTVGQLISVQDSFFHSRRSGDYQAILIYYLCYITGGELSTDGFDDYEKEYADLAEWIDLADRAAINFKNTGACSQILEQAITMSLKG